MSRLRRLVLSDRYFFVTCNLLRTREKLANADYAILARAIGARRQEHGFLLTTWVFLPDHWHAIIAPHHPKTISVVMESIKVASTRQINTRRQESGKLWQGRFFDRALRTVKEYHECVEYIHWNPVRRGLVDQPEDWAWSSFHQYAEKRAAELQDNSALRGGGLQPSAALEIDRVRLPADAGARLG